MQDSDPFVDSIQKWMEVFMQRSMHHFIRYARDSGLSVPQVGALFHIQHKGGSGVTGLGDGLGVTSAAASQMLERLVQQGLISRSEDPEDRRAKQLALTEKGRQILHESIIQARQVWLDELAGALSNEEKEQVCAALEIMIKKVNQLKCENKHCVEVLEENS